MNMVVEGYINELVEFGKERKVARNKKGRSIAGDKLLEKKNEALKLLEAILDKNHWSEEFVTAFAVYCNFYILNGLHKELGEDFGLNGIYDKLNLEEKQYLKYIHEGIYKQEITYFKKAINMNLFDFDLPKLYVYLFCFLEICLYSESELQSTDMEDEILSWYDEMKLAEKNINGPLKELLKPIELTYENAFDVPQNFGSLLPCIITTTPEKFFLVTGRKIRDFKKQVADAPIFQKNEEVKKYRRGMINCLDSLLEKVEDDSIKLADSDLMYCEREQSQRDSENIGSRKRFLLLPTCISQAQYNKIYTVELLRSNKALNEKNKELTEARQDKKKVIKQFSHTYMNMRATSLYNIATELLKNEDKQYRNYGRKLLYEYSVKQNLTKDVEMLKLRFEDNIEDLYKIIANSILTVKDEGVRIGDLIDDAITRCMVTLVHDGSNSAKRLREKFENYDWICIRNNFENELLLSDNKDVKKWFNSNMFPMNVTIGDDWEQIVFEEDSYAALLFVDILSELLINIFKYADKSESVELKFINSDDKFMILSAKNHTVKCVETKEEGGYGLESEAEIIRIINEVNGEKVDPLSIKNSNGEFEVQFRISKNLFWEGR